MRNYRASGAAPVGGIVMLLVLAVLGGAVIGGILWAIEHFTNFYLVVLFPLAAGAILGGILAFSVRSSKVRSPIIAGLFGLAAGLIAYGVYHFAGYYVTFRGEARTALVENGATNPTEADVDELVNAFLEAEVDETGFMGYMNLAAQEGITINRTVSSSSSGINLQGTGAWVYWGIEVAAAALIAAFMAGRAAGEPFDENAGTWYGKPQLVAVTDKKSRKELVNALKNGDFQGAGRLLTTQELSYPRIEVYTRRSEDPTADVYVQVNATQRQNRTSVSQRGVVSANEYAMLERAMGSGATL
jgi:hypothetical protein